MTPRELTVGQVMVPDPVTVAPDCRVGDAVRLMAARRIGAVPVAAADGTLAGLFTERDVLARVADAPPGWADRPVADWMDPAPGSVGPDAGWDDAVARVSAAPTRRLPVVDGRGRVVGLVTARMLLARRDEHLTRLVDDRTRELRRAVDQLMARDAEVRYTLRSAGRVQQQLLLPAAPPAAPGLRWAVHFAPLDHLGGDYYDFAPAAGGRRVGFLIADASGHSVSAAMVAVLTRFAFADVIRQVSDPADVLDRMNGRLQGLVEERFVSAFYADFDPAAGTLRYAGAGHPPPLLYQSAAGAVRPLASRGMLLGVVPDEAYPARDVAVGPGDLVCFYTDGLTEARNEIGDMYGTDRLTACVAAHGRRSAGELLEGVLADLRRFAGSAPLTDDLTVAVVEVVSC